MTGIRMSVLFAAALLAAAGCGGEKKDDGKAPAPAAGGGAAAKPAAPAAGGGGAYDAAKSTASVKITVKWTGAKPAAANIVMSGDAFCTSAHSAAVPNPRFTVNDNGTLPEAFVSAAKGPHEGMTGFPEPAAFTLDQHGCMYSPHVFGVRVGQQFTIKNSDGTTHNVHARPKTNKEFNDSQIKDATSKHSFASKEPAIAFNCDIHSWMSAYAFVVDHPFFGVTGADGTVTISGLPAGTYKFRVWHESFTAGAKSLSGDVEVTLKDGESVSKDVEVTETK